MIKKDQECFMKYIFRQYFVFLFLRIKKTLIFFWLIFDKVWFRSRLYIILENVKFIFIKFIFVACLKLPCRFYRNLIKISQPKIFVIDSRKFLKIEATRITFQRTLVGFLLRNIRFCFSVIFLINFLCVEQPFVHNDIFWIFMCFQTTVQQL